MSHSSETCDTCKQIVPKRLNPYRDPLGLNGAEIKEEAKIKEQEPIGAADKAIGKSLDNFENWVVSTKGWTNKYPYLQKFNGGIKRIFIWSFDHIGYGIEKCFDGIAWSFKKTGLTFILKHFGKATWWLFKNTIGWSLRQTLGRFFILLVNGVKKIKGYWQPEHTEVVGNHMKKYGRYYFGCMVGALLTTNWIVGLLAGYYLLVVPSVYSLVNKASLTDKQLTK